MNIKMTKFTIKNLPPRHSVMLQARHGVGKSEVVRQIAQEMSREKGVPYGFIDIRLSQREVGDIIGMPRAVDQFNVTRTVYKDGKSAKEECLAQNVTIHDIPYWFPSDGYGFLFLDELNRATREVQQAAFELVLDYRLNFHELPEGWRVLSAINEEQDVYSVLGMDPALKDRFYIINFRPTTPEWLKYAEDIGVHRAVIQYINKFDEQLDPPDDFKPEDINPSRRSWVKLSEAMNYMEANGYDLFSDYDYLTFLSEGYVGSTIAVHFVEYIKKNYKVYSAEDILNKWSEHFHRDFKKMDPPELSYYSDLIAKWIKNNHLSKKQQANLLAFYKTIPNESAAGLWSALINANRDEVVKWYDYPGVEERTTKILGKKSATE